MKVVCINEYVGKSGNGFNLTKGKLYDVLTWEANRWDKPRYYVIVNDIDKMVRYDAVLFDTLENVRDNKLNELGV